MAAINVRFTPESKRSWEWLQHADKGPFGLPHGPYITRGVCCLRDILEERVATKNRRCHTENVFRAKANNHMVADTQKTQFSFRPRARIIRTIGDRLISGPEAAVIELVKNAHDADASYVKVIFEPPLEEGKGRIIIEDDGHGMNFDDIEKKWMEPATTDKIERRKSPKGRKLLGSKGIGRFAAAKLGRFLELETTALKKDTKLRETTRVHGIDWNVFDEDGYLSDISFPVELLSLKKENGTRLTIEKLRDTWTKKAVEKLFQEMRRLISPIEESKKSKFRIYLDLSACTKTTCGFDGASIVNGTLPRKMVRDDPHRILPFPILASCDYEVEGAFDENGTFEGTFTIHRGGLPPDKFTLKTPLNEDLGESSCGIVIVHLFIFDREEEAVRATIKKAKLGKIPVKVARAMIDLVAGVAIYRDQFRIRPYGDSDNDWMTLDTRRVQKPTLKIGHNQVSGLLLVDADEASGLIERSSREGFEENGSYKRLQRLILELFSRVIEPRRLVFRQDTRLVRRDIGTFDRAYKIANLTWAKKFFSKLPEEERKTAERKSEKVSRQLHGQFESFEEKQAMLEGQVTLGKIVAEVLHEGRNPVVAIQRASSRLSKWWSKIFDDTKEARERQKKIPKTLRGMEQNSEKLNSLFNMLEPLAGGSRDNEKLYNPNQVVLDSTHLFESRIGEHGISINLESNIAVPDISGFRGDLSAAVVNIFDNSIFWLSHHKIKSPEISVSLEIENSTVVIDITDNGPGIPAEFLDRVFDIGFSLKPDGTGLGLSIAQEAINRSGGTLELLPVKTGAGFRISLPIKINRQ